jgi:hypothetical protein
LSKGFAHRIKGKAQTQSGQMGITWGFPLREKLARKGPGRRYDGQDAHFIAYTTPRQRTLLAQAIGMHPGSPLGGIAGLSAQLFVFPATFPQASDNYS